MLNRETTIQTQTHHYISFRFLSRQNAPYLREDLGGPGGTQWPSCSLHCCLQTALAVFCKVSFNSFSFLHQAWRNTFSAYTDVILTPRLVNSLPNQISSGDEFLLMQFFAIGEHRYGDSTHPSGTKWWWMESMIKSFTFVFNWPVKEIDWPDLWSYICNLSNATEGLWGAKPWYQILGLPHVGIFSYL